MTVIWMLLLLVVAVAIGAWLNFRGGKAKASDPKAGASVADVLGGISLLGAFIIALVLSGTASSYEKAASSTKEEANTIDAQYEAAEYADMPFRQQIQGASVCYARAVAGPEWHTMAVNAKSSPVPNNWTGTGPLGVRHVLIAMGPDAKGFNLVQPLDARRGDLRSERIAQASPTVPAVLFWLMVVLIGFALGGLAYCIPRAENRAQIIVLTTVTVLFMITVLLIRNLDKPYNGPLAQKPTTMRIVAASDTGHYIDSYQTPPPCNGQGQPT